MPKKSKKDDHKEAKHKGRGGHRTTKKIRDAAEPVRRLSENPLVGEIVAGAVLAGVEAFLGGEGGKKAKVAASNAVDGGRKGGEIAAEGAADAADETGKAASLIGYAVAVAAGEIASRIVNAYEKELGPRGNARLAKTAGKKAADMVESFRGKRNKAPKEPGSDEGE